MPEVITAPTPDELAKDLQRSRQPKRLSAEKGNNAKIIAQLEIIEAKLKEAAANDVISLPGIITMDGVDIIKPNTLTLVQGGFGAHKSRLAAVIAACLLAREDGETDFLGYKRNLSRLFAVAYLDTERNLREEFPRAIQYIRRLAGYNEREELDGFYYNSIKQFDRHERQLATKLYINQIRQQTDRHLVVLLDVITDCMSSFNSVDSSMELYDFLGNLCEQEDCTIIAVIHENPGSDKARGHAGTEGWNKSSTVIKIGFEKDKTSQPTDLIRMEFLKLRHALRPSPTHLVFSPITGCLELATDEEIADVSTAKRGNEKRQQLEEAIQMIFRKQDSYGRVDFVKTLEWHVPFKSRVIEKILKTIIEDTDSWLHNEAGEPCQLVKTGSQGVPVTYTLQKVENQDTATTADTATV